MTMSARAWRAGISIGTAHTVAMLRAPGTLPRPILAGGSPLMPSSADPVYPGHRDPLLPGSLLPRHLARIAVEVRRAAGAEVVETTVACPPEWAAPRRAALAEAVSRTGLTGVEVVGETVAAAALLGERLAAGSTLLVVDAGASSCDVGLVRRTAEGYEQVGFETLGDTGGIRLDVDLVTLAGARIAEHDRTVWHRLDDPLTPVDRAARLLLREEARALKERLSSDESASFTVPLADTELTVTRTEFEALARLVLLRVVQAVTGMGPASALLVVGGGSRIPLLRALLESATGLEPITVRQPELAVAEGCALLPRLEAPPSVVPHRAAPPPVAAPRSPVPLPQASGTRAKACLQVAGAATRFTLPTERAALIGTALTADLRLTDSYASRRHAEVSWSGGLHWVADAGSTNGTTLNGRRVAEPEPLRAGDVIGVGKTRVTYTIDPGPAPAVRSDPPPAEGRGGRRGAVAVIAAGAGLAVAGLGWWLLSAYAAMIVGLSALAGGLVLLAVGVARIGRR